MLGAYRLETFMALHAFIVGANGQIGRAVGERLLRAGWAVTCAQRGDALPELLELGARAVKVDRNEAGSLEAAIGNGTDAVIDTIAYDENHAAQLLEIQDVVGYFSVISSASVYCDDQGRTLDEAKGTEDLPEFPVPIPETQPTTAAGPATYSTRKAALENKLFANSRVPFSLIRACAIYGPNSKFPREWWFIKRWADDRTRVPLLYASNIFHTSATPNIAALIEAAITARFRGPLNAGDPQPPSLGEIGTTIAHSLSWTCEFVMVPNNVGGVGETPWSAPMPFVVDMHRAAQIGYKPVTDYASYAPEVCRWLIDAARDRDWREIFPVLNRFPDLFDYAAEDNFLKTSHTGILN